MNSVNQARLILEHREFCNNRVKMTNAYNEKNLNLARWYKLKCEMNMEKMKKIKTLILNETSLKPC